MSRRAARCTQADIARAIRAASQTGGGMAVEVLPDGTIRIAPAPASPQPAPAPKLVAQRRIVL